MALLGSDADRIVDAIDDFGMDFARHERFAQLALAAAPSCACTARSSSIFAISASEEISLRSVGRNRPDIRRSSVHSRPTDRSDASSVLRASGRMARTACAVPSGDFARVAASRARAFRSLEKMPRSPPSGPSTLGCCSPTTSMTSCRLLPAAGCELGIPGEHARDGLHARRSSSSSMKNCSRTSFLNAARVRPFPASSRMRRRKLNPRSSTTPSGMRM